MIHFFDETGELDSLEEIAANAMPAISLIMNDYHKTVEYINVIFVDDDALLEINRKFLQHDYYTDIITFNYSEKKEGVEGELYISLPRLRENAAKFGKDFLNELYRVVIHGALHLAGMKDETKDEKKMMQSFENQYLKAICFT